MWLRSRRVAGGLILALLVLGVEGSERRLPQGGVGAPFSTRDVQIRSDANAVTFTNADGRWTIFRRCLGTDVVGVGYVARYVSRLGHVVSNDVREDGFGELNNPEHGGIGTFGVELARGSGDRSWENTWHLSMRRCGPFGVTSWSRPSFGPLPAGGAYYRQDVWLGDGWTKRLLRLRYRWRFRRTGVDLYGSVTSLCGACPSPLGPAFVKEPKLVVTLNGQASEQKFRHFATFTEEGVWLRALEAGHNRECSYAGSNPREGTGHCFDEARERVRWSYADTERGGCAVTRPCFHAVFRSHAEQTGSWESRSAQPAGLEAWALDAAEQPGAGAEGCLTIDGEAVYSPAHENARGWEYAGNKAAPDDGYENSMVMAKGWDGCKNALDAPALYRLLQPGSYGFFLSLSLGDGWRRS
ncbi:MAG: hypothetical protein H0U03_13215 [Actinobacteria bacterium]|nr:hypothetical protein [Actinomycetota bacterium]